MGYWMRSRVPGACQATCRSVPGVYFDFVKLWFSAQSLYWQGDRFASPYSRDYVRTWASLLPRTIEKSRFSKSGFSREIQTGKLRYGRVKCLPSVISSEEAALIRQYNPIVNASIQYER